MLNPMTAAIHTVTASLRALLRFSGTSPIAALTLSSSARILTSFFVLFTLVATAGAQSEEALYIIRGTRYQYGFFGRGSDVPPAIGPVQAPYQPNDFHFPGENTNRSIINQLNITPVNNNQLQVHLNNESLLHAARLDGNDWGGGVDLQIDVYVKGRPGTSYSVQKLLAGQVTAVHGGGLGTTQAFGDGTTAVWNNGVGAQSLPSTDVNNWTGMTSTLRHPSRWGYYFARTVSISAWDFTFQSIDFCFPGCPQLLNFRGTSDLNVLITAECLGNLCPADAATGDWNGGETQIDNNCYNYATNSQSSCFASPGSGGGAPLGPLYEYSDGTCMFLHPDGTDSPISCETIAAAARADGLDGPYQNPNGCPQGSCLVYLVVNPVTHDGCQCDYHWYRRNADGSWSSKAGNTEAAGFTPGEPPRFVDGCYTVPCGYFCVPCDARVAPQGSCPPSAGQGARGGVGVSSGAPNPSFPIPDPAAVQALANAIAAGIPTSRPTHQPGLGFAGLTLSGDPNNAVLPAFTRFFDGIIYVHDASGVRYLRDVAGGYELMRQLAVDSGFGYLLCGLSISQQPDNVAACPSSDVNFSITASGAVTYQWRKGAAPINTGSGGNPSAATATLTLMNVQLSDADVYDCIVTNSCGSTTSNPATLTVGGPSCCIGDYNQDGGIDGSDVSAFFTDWESGSPAADVNADGGVDGADVDTFFAHWESGC